MDFLKMGDVTPAQLQEILTLSLQLKHGYSQGHLPALLDKKTLLMLFEKNSSRTRVSFETAMTQLGGHAIFLDSAASQRARGESFYDTGAALGGMADFIMARLYRQYDLQELARGSPVPVINGLTEEEHPCQTLADLLTLHELGKLRPGSKLAFVGDCSNNVARSLMAGAAMAGLSVSLIGPKESKPSDSSILHARSFGPQVDFTLEIPAGLKGADVVYTDTWISMGDEQAAEVRRERFEHYQVNARLMAHAKPDAVFMHCLPAHRGEEVSDEVMDGPQSVVFKQANNRLHAQKGLLAWLASRK
ncbi:Ornithine carbamoyltransferase [uncultured archaeon]|nr:Ornithine carbamoyltransferase [uncultured archaeon]